MFNTIELLTIKTLIPSITFAPLLISSAAFSQYYYIPPWRPASGSNILARV